MYLDISEKIEINGAQQYISIRAKNNNAPLLLYIHGGPGDAALPLVLKYNKDLENHFTVVVWEQRGSGKSYYKFLPNEKISIQTFVEDAHTLIKLLLNRFNQRKLYLVGHSWGSVIGLKTVQLYPDLIESYIGCGQVVNMKESSKLSYEFALKKNIEADNNKVVNRLKAIDYSYTNENWLNDLLFVTDQVIKHKGSAYNRTNYNHFIWDFISSKGYSLIDIINRQKGSLQSIKYLWPELMNVNFEPINSFKVPIIFIQGRYDHHVSSEMVYNYFKSIKSKADFYWFEKSCHFPQWSEPEAFTKVLCSLLNK